MSWQKIFISVIIILAFGITAMFHGNLPDKMASHWNAAGEVDGYMPKDFGALLFPGMLLLILIIYSAVPVIDPLGKNIEKFRAYYENFFALLVAFLFLVHLQVMAWNLGIEVSPNLTMPIGVGALLFYAGVMMGNAKRNWSVGIRTPWTLSSETVWKKTHVLGGKLFKLAGVISAVGVFLNELAVFFIIGPVLLFSAYLFAYSYFEYRKENQ